MRGKVAKQLRRAAELQTVGNPHKEYHYTRLMYLLVQGCTRKVYKDMKREYKAWKRKIH